MKSSSEKVLFPVPFPKEHGQVAAATPSPRPRASAALWRRAASRSWPSTSPGRGGAPVR